MRRIIAISDLHIGGDQKPMLGHPEQLEDFLERLAEYTPPDGEELELVIHGDLIDFLAESPSEAWSSSEAKAVEKFTAVTRRQPSLFAAFRRCAAKLRRCSILLGNHDIELAYPKVRDALFRKLDIDAHRSLFVTSNEAYRIGDLLIEHGNRYDPWNAIDHDGLRQIVSASSRGEMPPAELKICPGSRLVHEVMNPLKERYHFIDLLKPEDKLVALLLTTLEPKLKRDLMVLFRGATSYVMQVYRKAHWQLMSTGRQPGQRHLVSGSESAEIDGPLASDITLAFAEELEEERAARLEVSGRSGWLKRFLEDQEESLKARLERGEGIEHNRLKKLQVALRHILQNDATFIESDRSGPYVKAAEEMIGAGVAKVVVMGHTHLARNVKIGGGRYINTGTWADLLRIDHALLEDTEQARSDLMEWLRSLATDRLHCLRVCEPHYADVRLNNEGHLIDEPRLRRHRRGVAFV